MDDHRAESAPLDWRDGVPVSRRFDDPYYSLQGGLAETRHVFLAGNGLPERFRDGFHIAELGFGTGLNFLATLAAWRDAGVSGRLTYTAFEAFPLGTGDLTRALAPFDDLPVEVLAGAGDLSSIAGEGFELRVIAGDANATLPVWDGLADAWYLDGFSPAKNPELWNDALLREVTRHTAPGGTFATYSAAGDVRRTLDAAGFDVVRAPGFARKRHMSRGVLRERGPL